MTYAEFERSDDYETALQDHVYDNDLPLCMSRQEHIESWRRTLNHDWAFEVFQEDVREGWRRGE